ncbi:MAG: hypothetical protein KDK99_05445 [Verrucomicrobiales bacterium]|nr:hypothetical protein [Verrucomicrobiales bacterium]
MRYFTYLAEQAFKTSATGERLFYRGGPWSRPFIIPDADTEQRLFKKQTWIFRILLGGLIVGQPFLFILRPEVVHQPYGFLVYFFVVMLVYWFIGRVVLATDLRGLQRARAPLRPRSFYGQKAQRHSRGRLVLGLTGSLILMATGAWMLRSGANQAIGILCVGFGGLCAVAWGYALYLKSQIEDVPEEPDENRHAEQ